MVALRGRGHPQQMGDAGDTWPSGDTGCPGGTGGHPGHAPVTPQGPPRHRVPPTQAVPVPAPFIGGGDTQGCHLSPPTPRSRRWHREGGSYRHVSPCYWPPRQGHGGGHVSPLSPARPWRWHQDAATCPFCHGCGDKMRPYVPSVTNGVTAMAAGRSHVSPLSPLQSQ